jgi:Peptidase family C25/FlgD Ig-like domain/Propeptide_C25
MKCEIILTIFILILHTFTVQAVEFSWERESISLEGNFEIESLENIQYGEREVTELKIESCINTQAENYILPIFTETVSLPETGNYKLAKQTFDYTEIHLDKQLPFSSRVDSRIMPAKEDKWLPEQIVNISSPMIMRGERFCQISCSAVQYNPSQNKIRLLIDINIELEIDHSNTDNPLYSNRRSALFSNFMQNIKGSQPYRGDYSSNYLFIAPQICESTLLPLIHWKEQLGYKTKLVFMEDIGSTNQDVKDYLQNAYDNWEFPPEYVVLVGDTDGNIVVPSFYVAGGPYSPWDVTDHTYTLLDGDDYFPDLFIGRLSVRSISELQTVVVKLIKYQKEPYLESDWMSSALMMAYIYEFSGIYSHRETVLTVGDKLLDFEYTKIDTFINPYSQNHSQISEFINSGQSIVNFRGCGDMEHWSSMDTFHFMDIDDINELSNGWMLPMVTSMACGTGNFADTGCSPCFGETWLVAGMPSNPKGGIGFIGPSERDTQTEWNNCNNLGVYQGFACEDLLRCGEMLLRGKMELFYNYPLNHEYLINNSDHFYFYVYNLLGDPGLRIWTHTPDSLEFTVQNYCVGMDHITVNIAETVQDPAGFTVAVTSADSLIAVGLTDQNGEVLIPVTLPEGTYQITAHKADYIPQIIDLEVSESDFLGIQNITFDTELIAGTSCTIDFDVYNYASSIAQNITLDLISTSDMVSVENPHGSISTLDPGSVSNCSFEIEIENIWYDLATCDLVIEINSDFGENISLIPLEISSPKMSLAEFAVQNSNGYLIQNEECDILISLYNFGSIDSDNFSAKLICLNDKVNITQGETTFSSIASGEVGTALQLVQVISDNVISGETSQFVLELSDDITIQALQFEIPIGMIDQSSPTFCDFGYVAIESADVGNFDAPVYEWIEIDPTKGGNGTEMIYDHTISDGSIGTIQLPFEFLYFNCCYNKISICTEGYLCMGETDRMFYRNRNIPAGIGSAAMIAPFWDSLEDGLVYTYYDLENHRFIIQWSDWKNSYDPVYNNTFEVILYDNLYLNASYGVGEILFQYQKIHNIDADGNYATIGIENEAQTEGLLMTFANIDNITAHPISSESSTFFTVSENTNVPFLTCNTPDIQISTSSDSTITREIMLANHASVGGDISYTVSFSHFTRNGSRSSRNPNRSLENDNIIQMSGNYIPVYPRNILFYLIHNSPDGEPIRGVTIDFPDGFYVNSATNANELLYNGEVGDGVEVSWGFEGELTISPSAPVTITVNVTVEESMCDPVEIFWYIEGDGSGVEPHSKSGTISMLPTDEDHLWISYPNGGETILPGLNDTILWDHYGDAEIVKIELSRNNGLDWELIEEQLQNNGEYNYIFTGPLSNECRVKLTTEDEEALTFSQEVFEISALNIIYPDQNTIMEYSLIDSLCWQDIGGIETVDIEISSDAGYSWETLAENVLNTGRYEFIVPGPQTNTAMFKISSPLMNVENVSSQFSIVDCPINWLSSDTIEGVIPAGQEATLNINVSPAGLEFGTYEAYVKIETEIGQILLIPLTLEFLEDVQAIENMKLYQNHPNPFNPFTQINFDLPDECEVNLKIYNARGQFIKEIADGEYNAGPHFAIWDGTDKYGKPVSSGIYLYKLETGSKTKAKKMILIK